MRAARENAARNCRRTRPLESWEEQSTRVTRVAASSRRETVDKKELQEITQPGEVLQKSRLQF